LENPWIAQEDASPTKPPPRIPFSSVTVKRACKFFPNFYLATSGDFNGLERKKFGNACRLLQPYRLPAFFPPQGANYIRDGTVEEENVRLFRATS
jgi:hypothetical protein